MHGMFLPTSLALLAAAILASAKNPLRSNQITAFVPFGDSYTDTFTPADGGTAWPTYAVGYAGKGVSLFPFARSGATCSNNLVSRPFPSVFESQLPLWLQEKANGSLSYLVRPEARGQENALYFLWIGTNDVGDNGLLTGQSAPGVSLVDVVKCMINWVKVVYQNGGRNFIFANVGGLIFVHRFQIGLSAG